MIEMFMKMLEKKYGNIPDSLEIFVKESSPPLDVK